MAPHPMYSVGYAGYYGISMIAASYKVLFISILAHAAQFAFLVLVENPHIEKTYNSPIPKKRTAEPDASYQEYEVIHTESTSVGVVPAVPHMSTAQPPSIHNLLGLNNLDLYRITDSSVLLVQLLFLALTALTPSTPVYQFFFVFNAAVWRIWYSVGIGYILNQQSTRKTWTRHFVKFGVSINAAWRQWIGTYHLSMFLCYVGFIAGAWKTYFIRQDWWYG